MTEFNHKLLVIDDNDVDRELIVRCFTGKLIVVQAATGEQGRDLFHRDRPDCVLLDYHLPDIDGFELLRYFAQNGSPVVILTGQGNEFVAVESMKHGAYDYLSKDSLAPGPLNRAVLGAIERCNLASALGQSESYNRALLSAIPDPILRIHRDGRLLDFLPGKGEGLPFDLSSELPSEGGGARGRHITEVLPTALARPLLETTLAALSGCGTKEVEIVMENRGRLHAFEARVTGCCRDDAVVVLRNVTPERDLERQFTASQRMEALGRMASGISHDFRNILAMVQGYSSLLLDELEEDAEIRPDIEVIFNASERGTRLIAQLLAFSRNQVQAPEVICVAERLGELAPMLNVATGSDTTLELATIPEDSFIEVDPSQFDQIIMNLLVNARDAMPKGGQVTIGAHDLTIEAGDPRLTRSELTPGSYIALTVSDTGEGMDEETQRHIFEPFFTTKSEGQGTGLGLATVYGIMQQNHGHIAVTSEPGKGTCFTLLFPTVEEEMLEETAPFIPSRGLIGHGTVLVVDDEESVRSAVTRILGRHGYKILEASEGQSALALADAHDDGIDLLLTDLIMPRIGGDELATELLQRKPDLKVLYMSGQPADVVAKHGVPPESELFVAKPFKSDFLLERVFKALED